MGSSKILELFFFNAKKLKNHIVLKSFEQNENKINTHGIN